ncbi:MAG: orotidine 5'-phosphate decarboxylase [Candidatus Hodarchaeales archaeon]
MKFVNLLQESMEKTASNICVGLDLASHGTRSDCTLSQGQHKLETLIKLIQELADHCCCFKINRQYILDLSHDEIKKVNSLAHELGRPVIVDHKVTDIGSTNAQAINHFYQEGFDAFTASPFAGNVEEICDTGHKYGLASFVLVLMSNPEAQWMKKAVINGIPIYQFNAKKASEFADGIVVGATGHITNTELEIIGKEISDDKVILGPGIGAQGGDVKSLLEVFGGNVLFNIGRAIIYSKSPKEKLIEYNNMIKKLEKLGQ